MLDEQLFEEVLASLAVDYNLTYEHPYDDAYVEIYKDGTKVAALNPEGRCLLANLASLTSQLSFFLR